MQPIEIMFRMLKLAAASLMALLALGACTSRAVLNDLTTDEGYTLTADVPYDRANKLTLDYASTAYWYQTEPHKPFPPLLPLEQRMPRL